MTGNAIDAALLSEILDHFGARPRPDRSDRIRYALSQCEARIQPRLPDSFPEFIASVAEIGLPGFRIQHSVGLRVGNTMELRLLAERFDRYRFLGAVESVSLDFAGNYLSTILVFDLEIFSPTAPRHQ